MSLVANVTDPDNAPPPVAGVWGVLSVARGARAGDTRITVKDAGAHAGDGRRVWDAFLALLKIGLRIALKARAA